MFDSPAELIDRLDAVIDQLLAVDFYACDGETLLEVARRSELVDRRLGAVRHRMVAAPDCQGVARERGHRDTAALLGELWNAAPAVARREVALARDLAPGGSLT